MSKEAPDTHGAVEQSAEWRALQAHRDANDKLSLAGLFRQDPERFRRYSLHAAGLLLDYSKNLVSDETLNLLLALAESRGVPEAIRNLFEGAPVNNTERRAALHVALRSPRRDSEQETAVHETLDRMERFVRAVQEGEWSGYTGLSITDVVNIGIGGSDLGPAMAYEALTPFHVPGITCHFVSNVDPSHLHQCLLGLNPETTLFVVASKTFSTLETMKNAEAARAWFLEAAEDEGALAKHFAAVSANVEKAAAFGIDPANIFPMWDWVGGRYSLWSAIGLPIALGVGMFHFRALLQGAHAMDEHFRTSEPRCNMPLLMALLALWYLDFHGAQSQAVLPYDQNLRLFPAFLQQLDMESLGKSVRRDGLRVNIPTGGIVWGSAGTNGQHSFHQLLHQGTHLIPADFIAAASGHYEDGGRHHHLLANCFAQSQALMDGKTLEQAREELRGGGMDEARIEALAPHKVVPGNRPSNTILMKSLEPATLGALVAAYEHKVYVQSVILQINAFDQWGVELGKALSANVFRALEADGEADSFDSSTNGLINFCRQG